MPEWLDAGFLYRINYGPAKEEDVDLAKKTLRPFLAKKILHPFLAENTLDPLPIDRQRITLLDRRIAAYLHRSLFAGSTSKQLFSTDWTYAMNADEDNLKNGRLTPFDYPSSNDEINPLLWCEVLTVACVWSRTYASAILGTESRPPMAAVACDIIALVNYLKSITGPESIFTHLERFPSFKNLHSVLSAKVDLKIASRGFFLDLFRIAIARRITREGLDKNIHTARDISRMVLQERRMYPGVDSLGLGKSRVSRSTLDSLYGALEDMRASYICSGPFKLALTESAMEHLTLSSDGKIRLFWEGRNKTSGTPGHTSFLRYKAHTLGEFHPINLPANCQKIRSDHYLRRTHSVVFPSFHSG
jgi:hypothetical protein